MAKFRIGYMTILCIHTAAAIFYFLLHILKYLEQHHTPWRT